MTPTLIAFQPYQFVGTHQSLSVSSVTPVSLPAGCNAVLVQATGQNVRIRFDGNNPTTGSGFQIRAGDPPFLLPMSQTTFLALQEAATATLEVQGVAQAFA